MKEIRPILKINHDLCDGCGACVPHCAEKAIYIENGKLHIIAENLCDGIGACLGVCPKNALSIENRLSDTFDHTLVEQHLKQNSIASNVFEQKMCPSMKQDGVWPIKLALAPKNIGSKKVALVADCVAMTVPSFRENYIKDDTRYFLVCPRLENKQQILQKMKELHDNDLESLQIYRMDVPCCCIDTLYDKKMVENTYVFNTTGIELKG